MNKNEELVRQYFIEALGKKIYSCYKKDSPLFGESYFINDAYVIYDYEKEDISLLALDRLQSIYDVLSPLNISEKLIGIDQENKLKVTKIVHGDLSYDEKPSESQIRNVAKALKKLHKNSSKYDVAPDLVSEFYELKNYADHKINKILENRIVREFNEIKDKTPLGLCHNYLSKDNVIYRYDNVLFINYELGNINYLYFDLASYLLLNNINDELRYLFLTTYFGSSYNSLKGKRVEIFLNFVKGYYYYMYQYLYKITNKEKYLKLIEAMKFE